MSVCLCFLYKFNITDMYARYKRSSSSYIEYVYIKLTIIIIIAQFIQSIFIYSFILFTLLLLYALQYISNTGWQNNNMIGIYEMFYGWPFFIPKINKISLISNNKGTMNVNCLSNFGPK